MRVLLIALLGGVAAAVAAAASPASEQGAPRPRIVVRPIPYGPVRRAEMAAYAARHYGPSFRTWRLVRPRVIVEHYTANDSYSATWNTFAPDRPDPELHELPGTCAHFVIDRDGTIYQLVALDTMCRHTVGLNYTAIGIEHVGTSDAQVLGNAAQMRSSLALTAWLAARFGIPVRNVIGHNESLSSPYHRERVARLRTQTHGDMRKSSMDGYRARLRAAMS
jgi:beta-N-acetylhexosaminidase